MSEEPAPKRRGATAFMRSSARDSGRSTARFDPHTAHAARICNFWLGGKDHFPADREVGEEVMRLRPQIVAGVRANRCFLRRVVRPLASRGVRQFLDIGTGIPVLGSTHEIAQEADPRSRVVYVDNDSMVLAHARALLASGPEGSCDYLDADLHDTGYLLREASRTLDFSQPVAVLLLAVLQLIPDVGNPGGLVTELASALAPASCIAISHLTADFAPGPVAAAAAAYNAAAAVPVTARTHAQVTALFGGLSLIAPGVVPITVWRPDIADALPQPADLYGGVARTVARRW